MNSIKSIAIDAFPDFFPVLTVELMFNECVSENFESREDLVRAAKKLCSAANDTDFTSQTTVSTVGGIDDVTSTHQV